MEKLKNSPRKRKVSTERSVVPCKQGTRLKSPAAEIKLKFTLDEAYVVSEISEANKLITKLYYDDFVQCHRQYFLDSFQKMYDLYWQNNIYQVPHVDDNLFRIGEDMYKSVLGRHGKMMFESLRSKVPDGLAAIMGTENFSSLYFHCLSFHFNKGGMTRILDQLKMTESDAYINLIQEKFPLLKSMPALDKENFVDFKSPYLISRSDEEKFEKTMDKLGEWLGSDPQLYSLSYLYLMVSASPNSKLGKNRNLKMLCSDIANLMFRYLSSKEGYTDQLAAVAVHQFRGLVPQIRQCGDNYLERGLKFHSEDTSLANIF